MAGWWSWLPRIVNTDEVLSSILGPVTRALFCRFLSTFCIPEDWPDRDASLSRFCRHKAVLVASENRVGVRKSPVLRHRSQSCLTVSVKLDVQLSG